MNYYEDLKNYIETNPNWKEDLKKAPYSLKSLKECTWHKNWYMFVYNLFESDLTNPVVRACRGIALEIVNNKVIRPIAVPYFKFFGYGDPSGKDLEDAFDWNSSFTSLKIDGILIKAAKVDGKMYFFINGSFDLNCPIEPRLNPEGYAPSSYGEILAFALQKEAKDILINFNKTTGEFFVVGGWTDNIPEGTTLMFELTSPSNIIICKYNETKLWWHGCRKSDGKEVDVRTLPPLPYERPTILSPNNIEDIKTMLADFDGNVAEGVVICDKNFNRLKIKCDSYLKIKFSKQAETNNRILFKAVMDDEYDDLLCAVPTLQAPIENIKQEIKFVYDYFNNTVLGTYKKINPAQRVDWVKYVRNNICTDLQSMYMFALENYPLGKLESYLEFISLKRTGYNTEFKNLINKIKLYG